MDIWKAEIAKRLAGLKIDPVRERDIVDELSLHLEARVAELQRDGVGAAQARAIALRELDATGLHARLASLRLARTPEAITPGTGRGGVLAGLWRDVRLALRLLRAKPAFACVAILTLALGLGANTAIFSVVHAVLLRPLPFHQPERLVFLWSSSPNHALENLTPGRLVDFSERTKSFASVAGFAHRSVTLTGRGAPERLSSASTGSAFFDTLGVEARHGQVFRTGSGGQPLVVLTHRVWVRLFNADPGIVGSSITLNGIPHTVTGVMPESFIWPTIATASTSGAGPEVFTVATRHEIPDTPVVGAEDMRLDRRTHYLRAVARIRAGVTLEEAKAEVSAVAAALEREFPETESRNGAVLVQVRDQIIGDRRQPLLLLLGAVALVLLIACANVANLLMGRTALRRREFEVRLALGAGRRRLIQQLLIESAVLALIGAAAGIVIAWWSLGALITLVPEGVLGVEKASLNVSVLAFSFVLAAVTAGIFGLLPARQAARMEGRRGLGDARTVGMAGRGRARTLIAGAEVAIAIALVIGASLLVRSFVALQRVDVGLDVAHMLTFDLVLSGERARDRGLQVAFYEQVLERIRALPGVAAAGMAVTLPIGGDTFGAPVIVDGRPLPPEGQEPSAGYQMVSPGFFEAAGVPFVAGRDVSLSDTRDRPRVAVVNEAFAAAHWPGESALGRRMRFDRDPTYPRIEVVGIVRNLRHNGPAAPPRPEFYLPYTQSSFSFMAVVVKAHGDPASLAQPVRQAVMALDPNQPISRVMTMEEHLRNDLAEPRFLSQLTLLFGGLALVLAAIGIYGVMAWSVTTRTQEFGVKLALGARPSQLLRQIVGEGMLLVGAGAVVGVAMAAALSQMIASFLFETRPLDPAAYLLAVGVVASAAALALIRPALRAMRTDPMRALRQ